MLKKEEVQKEIGLLVKQLREARGLSLMSFSDLVDMERSNIVRLEKGRTGITVATLIKIANGLNVPLRDLIP